MIRKKYIVLCFLSLVFVLVDCTCMNKPLVLKSVVLELPPSLGVLKDQVDQKKLSDMVENAIDKEGHFRFDANSDGDTLRLSLLPSQSQKESVVMVVATLSPGTPSGREHRSFTQIELTKGSMSGKDVSHAIQKVLTSLFQLQRGLAADHQIYIDRINASLAGEDVDQMALTHAISAVADSRSKEGIEALIRLLSSTKDVAVGNACLIALADIDAKDAMPAIIDFVERKPAIIRRQGIIAARRLATKLSAEWLLVMAYGHDDPIVRKEAREALEEVEQKLGITH